MEELEWVSLCDEEEGEGERDAGVKQKSHDDRQHVHSQRLGRVRQILNAHDLAGDETHQTEGCVPEKSETTSKLLYIHSVTVQRNCFISLDSPGRRQQNPH